MCSKTEKKPGASESQTLTRGQVDRVKGKAEY